MLDWLLYIHVRHDDSLLVRRSRSLALLLLILMAISVSLGLASGLLSGAITTSIVSVIAISLFLVVYLVNRSGRLALATTLLLVGFCLIQLNGARITGTPLPAIFFPCLVVVIAAAFGGPRAPLIWAAIVSTLPFVINLALYGSLVPPAGPIVLPNGVSAPPILIMEVIALALYWMLASISWLASHQLYQTLAEARAATQSTVRAQHALADQQADLAGRNQELTNVRQELEALVAALAVPVVPVADGIGLLPLVGAFDTQRMAEIERQTLALVSQQRMHALVIDLSGAPEMQSSDLGGLMRLCAALRLLGVTPMLAGLGPRGALQLSKAELALPRTVATVQAALSLLQRNN